MKRKSMINSIRSLMLSISMALIPVGMCAQEEIADRLMPVDLVNPLVGTLSSFELSNGNTYPVISRPWGMNSWTPQTGKMGDGWQYTYTAHKIRGFKQTHQPSPWINDYGQFSIMPFVGDSVVFDEEKRASWFSHKTEIATPYYYKVYLADYDLTAEMTPSERAAIFRLKYPSSSVEAGFKTAWIIIDAFDTDSDIEAAQGSNKITGYSTKNSGGVPDNFRCNFVITLDRPILEVKKQVTEDPKTGKHTMLAVRLDTKKNPLVTAKVASSFISPEQAVTNLREVDIKSFDQVRKEGRDRWNEVLGRIIVEGGSTREMRTFYSNLYRCLLFPRRFYELDPADKPIHYSPYNGKTLPGYMYTDTGFWDTFRALFPLLNLFYPDENKKIQEGLLNVYRESGFFPEWSSPGHRDCMVGNNSASVLADAYLKGVQVADSKTLIEGILKTANSEHPTISSTGRKGYKFYNKLGYVPCDVDIKESAARTLEYAYDDWCIYKLLQKLGRPQSEQETYYRRAQNYRNLYDPTSYLMRGRTRKGRYQEPYNPFKWGDAFTEGNAWHYSWSVFHDVQGLINLMGDEDTFTYMLDNVFNLPPVYDDSYYGFVIHEIREMLLINMGNYAHGNQPIQHLIYLYNYAKEPWKAQQRAREVMAKLYSPEPDGYCGDEDNGQTSAWYVFSALGFYPVTPGTDQYVIGSPLFPRVSLHFENGNKTVINAMNNSSSNVYIDQLDIDGSPVTRNYLTHEELRRGATLNFKMTSKPNKERGIEETDKPYSLTNEKLK
ncbi:GH92 family glycosyl hydrolase [Porphyromonas pogonae]|uniref:GH92 family glycosyl hydrolase n=1 Tax=Porphyromonas pogonae TaxID=867595 RepID=UPI002E78F0D0|nr:GH92 family glycosyl hydrolase [Porphyromonas pogonae]